MSEQIGEYRVRDLKTVPLSVIVQEDSPEEAKRQSRGVKERQQERRGKAGLQGKERKMEHLPGNDEKFN